MLERYSLEDIGYIVIAARLTLIAPYYKVV